MLMSKRRSVYRSWRFLRQVHRLEQTTILIMMAILLASCGRIVREIRPIVRPDTTPGAATMEARGTAEIEPTLADRAQSGAAPDLPIIGAMFDPREIEPYCEQMQEYGVEAT